MTDLDRTGEAPLAVPLSWPERARLRAKHAARLGRDVRRHGAEQQLWWLFPAIVVFVLFALAVTATTSALPVAVYTLF